MFCAGTEPQPTKLLELLFDFSSIGRRWQFEICIIIAVVVQLHHLDSVATSTERESRSERNRHSRVRHLISRWSAVALLVIEVSMGGTNAKDGTSKSARQGIRRYSKSKPDE